MANERSGRATGGDEHAQARDRTVNLDKILHLYREERLTMRHVLPANPWRTGQAPREKQPEDDDMMNKRCRPPTKSRRPRPVLHDMKFTTTEYANVQR